MFDHQMDILSHLYNQIRLIIPLLVFQAGPKLLYKKGYSFLLYVYWIYKFINLLIDQLNTRYIK